MMKVFYLISALVLFTSCEELPEEKASKKCFDRMSAAAREDKGSMLSYSEVGKIDAYCDSVSGVR